MAKQYRYPGTKPFSADQKGIFFGRGEAIEDLVELINIEQLIVLYSKSGLGKSSLINAGVLPKLEKENRLVPFSLRFGAYTSDKTVSDSPLSITTQGIQFSGETTLLDKIISNDNSLWYHLKNRQIEEQENRGYLLIFDQFEELFTYPDDQIAAFGEQLAELLYTTIPERFRKVVESEIWEKGNKSFLTEQEQKDLHRPLKIKVLMAIRSDRMSLLNRIKDHVPHILKICYELLPLSVENAEDAILIPAFLKDKKFASEPFDYDYSAIQKIINFLTDGGKQDIASFQLQILCEYIERKVITENLKLVKAHHLGDIESLFKNYYDDQIATLGSEEDQLAARKLLEEALIFEEEERRLTLYEGIIFKSFGIKPDLLSKLVESRLLRSERSSQGDGFNYEISHDSLVSPILKSKAKRIAKEEQNRRIEEEKRKLEKERKRLLEEEKERQKLLKIERKKRRRNLILATIGFVLSIIAVATSIWALGAQNTARDAQLKAEQALKDLKIAEEKRMQENYNSFKNSGLDKMSSGDFKGADDAFQNAYAFGNNRQDTLTIDSLLELNERRVSGQIDFREKMRQAKQLDNDGNRLGALMLYQQAYNMATLSQDKIDANGEIAVIKKGLESELVQHVRNAETYAKINECDLVEKELRQARAIRRHLSQRTLDSNKEAIDSMNSLKCG